MADIWATFGKFGLLSIPTSGHTAFQGQASCRRRLRRR